MHSLDSLWTPLEIPTPTSGVSPSPTTAFTEEEMNPKLPGNEAQKYIIYLYTQILSFTFMKMHLEQVAT